jgi:hypothetical protein
MKTRSASSRSGARARVKKPTIASALPGKPAISVEEFDRRADLPTDDPAGDLTEFIDYTKARRPGRDVQRVNVDFPRAMLDAIDREAARIGVNRQAFIKLRIADGLPK